MYPVRIVPRRGVGRRMLTPHLDLSARVLFVDAHFLHNRFHVTHTSLRDTDREAVPVGGKGGGSDWSSTYSLQMHTWWYACTRTQFVDTHTAHII